MIQSPSIVQIIVPAPVMQHGLNQSEDNSSAIISTSTTSTSTTPSPTLSPQEISFDDNNNDTNNENLNAGTEFVPQTQEPLRSAIPLASTPATFTEIERDGDIDDVILSEDPNENDYNQDIDEKANRLRDRSDYKYVESFESEKSNIPVQKIILDSATNDNDEDNEHEPKMKNEENIIHENFSQIPSVLPVPKALSSHLKDTSSSTEVDEPPEIIMQDQSVADV
jgi:hypothetical protein